MISYWLIAVLEPADENGKEFTVRVKYSKSITDEPVTDTLVHVCDVSCFINPYSKKGVKIVNISVSPRWLIWLSS